MSFLVAALLEFVSVALLLQIASIVLAHVKQSTRPTCGPAGAPGVSVLRPLCGLENNLEETLASTFAARYPDFEILFCVASPSDPVIVLVRRLIAAHPDVSARILIGNDLISGNPKLNNLAKGWRAAQADWILMADCNVLLPPDYIQRLFAEWRVGTGLVSAPPLGTRPDGFAARLECAFLNSFQGRWQLASARLGNGFAQGKMLFWRRDLLDGAGGLVALGREMAEDVAATKLVRALGLRVRLTARLFEHPVSRRSCAAVWARQLRWSKVRRLGFLPLFLAEIFLGGGLPMFAAVALNAAGVISLASVAAMGLVWYGAEWLLARASGWPAGPADVLAWICRDALLPALWLAAWFDNSCDWHGTAMYSGDVVDPAPAGDLDLAKP